MTWPSFGALSSAWLFFLFIPLILFYFLKLRRPRVEISSLVLWQAVLEDQRVNSPFQKFKRNLLLLFQLLLLFFLILSAMQPYLSAGEDSAEYLPIIIDNSASMGAIDAPGGKTRLEIAKQKIRDYLDKQSASRGMFSSAFRTQKICLISFSSLSRRIQDFTDNKKLLHQALDKLQVDDMPGDANEALQLVKALARSNSFDRVVLFSDGNFPARVDFELPFNLDYQKISPATENIGITDFVAKRSGQNTWDILVRIQASSEARSPVDLMIFQDGKSEAIEKERVIVAQGSVRRMIYRLHADRPSQLEARLKVDGFDAMDADNVAYLDLPTARPLTVIVAEDMNTFKYAIERIDHPIELLDYDANVSAVDLLITNQEKPSHEASVTFHVGVIPDDLKTIIAKEEGQDTIIDWRKDHALFQHVILDDLLVLNQYTTPSGVNRQDFEAKGYDVIAEGKHGPLVLSKRQGLQEHYYMLFNTEQSTLPYRIAFPVIVYNLVQNAMQLSDLAEAKGYRTGVLPERSIKAGTQCIVTGPKGGVRKTEADSDGVLRSIPAIYSGRYEIKTPTMTHTLAVSLLNSNETSLNSVDQIQFKELTVEAGIQLQAEQHLWYWLAICAFLFLIVEWWYFNRRIGGGIR